MQQVFISLQETEKGHLQNLASLLDDSNQRELEKLYYTILSDAAIAFQREPKTVGSYQSVDPGVSIAYFRRNKCPTVWKSSSRLEYDILYEIVCRITQMLCRDFLWDIWSGEKNAESLPSFL
jgi:hypothetical protein